MSDVIYSNCTIVVKDSAGNASNTLTLTSFTIDTTAPTVSSIYPADNQSVISIYDNISVTFSETMDNTSVTTNTANTTCSGSFQLSADNFSSCVQMSSSPSDNNSTKTFTVDPSDNLSHATTYLMRVTTGVKDTVGNTLSSQYETSSGFITWFTQQLGTASNDYGKSVTVDSSNNIYVAGYTEGGLDNNTNDGDKDIFLVKYNSSGSKQWTQQLGTSSDDFGYSVTLDSSNNIYVGGYTKGGLDNNTNAAGSKDIFLVKYNSSGTKQWAQQLDSDNYKDETVSGISVDTDNNTYLTGDTKGDLDNETNSNVNKKDIFLVKYSGPQK